MSCYSFEVARAALGTTRVIELPALATLSPAAGEAVLTVDKFALTANNITYGVAGDIIGYWQFFPAEGDWGRIPVWGKGTVVAENDSGLNVGDAFYGYFPMASYLVVEPEHVTERGFTDGAAHRQALPGVYNQYALMTAGNGFDRQFDDHQMIYRPLFTTSFVIDDYLDDNDHFGASNIILSSASSKTAFGLAFLLRKNRDVKVTGLTSAANKAFVESLNLYDQVVAYDALDSLMRVKTWPLWIWPVTGRCLRRYIITLVTRWFVAVGLALPTGKLAMVSRRAFCQALNPKCSSRLTRSRNGIKTGGRRNFRRN